MAKRGDGTRDVLVDLLTLSLFCTQLNTKPTQSAHKLPAVRQPIIQSRGVELQARVLRNVAHTHTYTQAQHTPSNKPTIHRMHAEY